MSVELNESVAEKLTDWQTENMELMNEIGKSPARELMLADGLEKVRSLFAGDSEGQRIYEELSRMVNIFFQHEGLMFEKAEDLLHSGNPGRDEQMDAERWKIVRWYIRQILLPGTNDGPRQTVGRD